MPVEDDFAGVEARQNGLVLRVGGEVQGPPADFAVADRRLTDRQGIHRSSGRVGDQLGTQADADHRGAVGQAGTDEGHFRFQEREAGVLQVADAHGPAHDHQQVADRKAVGNRITRKQTIGG